MLKKFLVVVTIVLVLVGTFCVGRFGYEKIDNYVLERRIERTIKKAAIEYAEEHENVEYKDGFLVFTYE